MTDVILSSFISLFALFGKEEQVDESRAKEMLVSYLRRHFGIRNIDLYLDLYSDMRMAYEMTDELNSEAPPSALHYTTRFAPARKRCYCCVSWSSVAAMASRHATCLTRWLPSSIFPRNNITTSTTMLVIVRPTVSSCTR